MHDLPPYTPAIVCFLDETGVVAQDDYFAVGVLTVPEYSELAMLVRKYRQRTRWTDEWHFSELTTRGLNAYRGLVDVLSTCPDWSFGITLADRTEFDVALACGDRFLAYERIAAQALAGSMVAQAQAVVLADEYSTPDTVRFEEDVRKVVNSAFGHNILAAAIRVSSDCHDLMQVSDVLTGGLTYPFRAHPHRRGQRPTPKRRLSTYIASTLSGRLPMERFDPKWLSPLAQPGRTLPR